MSATLDSMGYEFRLNEAAWFDADGQMNTVLTELSVLESDGDFEQWIRLLRAARVIAKGTLIIQSERPFSC